MMWLRYLLFRLGDRSFHPFGIEAREWYQGGMILSSYPSIKDGRYDAVIEALGDDAKIQIDSKGSLIYGLYLPKITMYDLFKICVRVNQMKAFL
jgi:hypothetical protein